MDEKRHIISLLVENEFGSLSRIAGLFSARGYNIHCLNVAPTNDVSISRMFEDLIVKPLLLINFSNLSG